MKSFTHLPEGYQEIYAIDLQKNKKMSLLVNFLSLVIAAVVAIPMHFVVPFQSFIYTFPGAPRIVSIGAFLGLVVLYMVLHELVHGVAMRICGTKKIKYGFTLMYAFAGSDDYYAKKPYIFIALAPIVVWGIVLLFLNFTVPISWFYVVYFVQMGNISGAAGDLYVTWRMAKLPRDILIKDDGVAMTVYSAEG